MGLRQTEDLAARAWCPAGARGRLPGMSPLKARRCQYRMDSPISLATSEILMSGIYFGSVFSYRPRDQLNFMPCLRDKADRLRIGLQTR